MSADWVAPLAGFGGGIVLGLAARLGRFCTLGAIEDAVFGAGMRRLHVWAAAIGVAMLGAALLTFAGLFDPSETFYLTHPVPLVSTVIGGLSFGLGMALVGTCGFGCLARLGGGDLSGLIVFLVIGVTGYAASSGAIGIVRAAILPEEARVPEQAGVAHMIGGITGISPLVPAILAGIGLLFLTRRLAWPDRLCGLAVGSVVAAGWAITTWQNEQDFGGTIIRSYSFVRPLGDTMIYAMTSSGTALTFGVAGVVGTIVGATAGALKRDEFRWEACDDARTLKRQIVGAALMGTGGVFAMGCTVGQGISAASVLAISAPVFLGTMFIGAWGGLQWLVRGSVIEPLREVLRLD